jgi:cytochrome oxidase Cu insertion factor (SCO1/SenC/PrrC family)
MQRTRSALVAVASLSLIAAACGSEDTGPSNPPAVTDDMTDDSMVDDMTDDSMVDDMTDDSMVDDMTDDMSEEGAGAEVALAGWQTLTVRDVDGSEFSLADYVGQPVLVEPFATWCSNCRSQLRATQQAAAELGDEAAVIALSVETDLDPAAVAAYAADNGLTDIRFAVMTPELLAALADALGNSAVNPPATPKIVIDAMGHAGDVSTGSESAADLVERLRGAGA